MEQEYLQDVVHSIQKNPLMALLRDRAEVRLTHYPHPVEEYGHIAVEVRVGDIRVSRRFTLEEVWYTKVPPNLMAIEIVTSVAKNIIGEGV